MLENLKFSEEEAVQVISTNTENNLQYVETWAVGKIMAEEKPNREVMYRVFRNLWYTKEEVLFVALKEDVIIVKFGNPEDRSRILNLTPWLFDNCLFAMLPFLRVYNIPLEFMECQTAIDIGNALGELVPIDWKDRNGGWTEFLRLKIKINISKPVRRVVKFVGNDRIEIICALKYERLPNFCYYCSLIGHILQKCKSKERDSDFNVLNLQYGGWLRVNLAASVEGRGIGQNRIEIMLKKKPQMRTKKRVKMTLGKTVKDCEEDSISNSPLEKRSNKPTHDGLILRRWLANNPSKSKCWNCRGIENSTTVRMLRQLLVANDPDIIFLCETKTNTNKMASIRIKCRMEGCLVVNAISQSGIKVEIKNYSNNHIDSYIQLDNDVSFHFTGFYENADLNKRQSSWDILRKVGETIRENWIIGGDFNAILDNAEKEGGRRKPTALIDDFRPVVDDLSLVDLKTDNGWFTWANNREGDAFVKERLDRFFISDNNLECFPFMATKVIRQSASDHDAILLDTEGRKPKEHITDSRLKFRYDVCWAKDTEAKNIIKKAWQKGDDIMEKIMIVGHDLGDWQYHDFKRLQKIYDGNKLKAMRIKLGKLVDKEEQYWAQRSRINWLKEGDRNTYFFHVRATNRRKKNSIERLKDMQGIWRDTTKDISQAAREYFLHLFKSNLHNNEVLNLDYIDNCISGEMNKKLMKEFTDSEIMEAFNQMDPRKAPGIDGLSGNFFKENWDVVGKDIINLCHEILRGDKNVESLNETIIVLIPKVKEPIDMTNFRPISLCRVIYKIVAKVLANRLKETLPKCISQNQSAFVLGRMIHNNILIAHEIVHYLQNTKNGSNKGFVIKLDMSKAYDRVE
ncbi:hypothetical protein CXB51_026860 [Gossypium anomalum]|uniref:Reverse transcriptase domain-containing protein n=1 Tax=Gossypium anomalum TaxID=47600 RepID=A0A8J5Y565_9ROSI|nr:hypothetical protein CXB51_026860 [Gossypium anomalum]